MTTMIGGVHDVIRPGDPPQGRDLDLTHLGQRLSARRGWLIGPTVLCFLGSAVFVNVVPPRYTGETKIIVENQDNYFTRPDKADVQPAQLPDDEAVQSQVQLVSSRDIAREAIRRLNLQGNPEFDPLADGISPVTRMLVLLGLEPDPLRVPPEERMLSRYFDRLTVFPVNKSRVLTVEFESKDSDLAARAANTISDLYIELQSTTKRDAARVAADSLRTLIADLRVRSAEAEAKAQAFRSQSGLLLGANNTTITSQQLADMSTQLAQAHSAQADAQARSKMIRDLIKAGHIAEVTDAANTDLIRRLSEQRGNVQADIAAQSRTLLPGHPRMQALNAQLGDLDRQLRTAAEKTARTLDNDARVAAGRVDNLTAAMNTQKAAIGATGTDQVKLNEYDLNARLLKDQLEFNTAKYQEAVAREGAGSTPADARVISRAVAPQIPSFPRKWPMIAIITIAGALLSLGMLIARELLSGRAFVSGEAADDLPVTVRADQHGPEADAWAQDKADVDEEKEAEGSGDRLLPGDALRATLHEGASDGLVVTRDPFLAILDEVLALKQPERALRVLICDSDDEGAAARLSVRLGRVLSRSFRAIVVDVSGPATSASHRALHQIAGADGLSPSGLGDLLGGDASFAEVIHRDILSRLHFVPAGQSDKAVDDEDGLSNVLDALAQTYDFAVSIGPLLRDAAPAPLLIEHADAVIIHALPDAAGERLDRLRELFGEAGVGGPTVMIMQAADEPAVDLPRFGVAAA